MTINIDFDHTCVVGDTDIGAAPVLHELIKNGHRLILFTCRSNKPYMSRKGHIKYNELTEAINWFKSNGITLYGIQINPEQYKITTSNKSRADYMIDDTAVGCPLIYDLEISERPFVDWIEMRKLLKEKGLL